MPRDPNVPDAFDVYTMVLLRRPPDAPQMSDEALDELQARHLAYRAQLRRDGVLIVNGPLDEQSDIAMRGLSVFACDLDEARRLSDAGPVASSPAVPGMRRRISLIMITRPTTLTVLVATRIST